MKLALFQFVIILITVIASIKAKQKDIVHEEFFSREHTNFLRAVAILMVIVHHVGNVVGVRALTPFGGGGVAIFLIISGFGLNESFKVKGVSNFWRSKFVRVLVPCWLVDCIFSVLNYGSFELTNFIRNLLCINQDWYIRYLFYWYFAFYFTARYVVNKYRIATMFAISIILLGILPEIEAEQSFSFLLGVVYSQYKERIKSMHVFLCKYFFLFFIIFCIILFVKQNPTIRDLSGTIIFDCIQLIIKLSLALFIIYLTYYLFIQKCRFYSQFMVLTGLMSYELYLMHCKMLGILKADQSFTTLVVFYVLSFSTAYLLYRFDKFLAKK